jgi:hypothetical protein
MFPSEQPPVADDPQPPPEVLAIAVALAALWPAAELADEVPTRPDVTGPWRLGGRRWERQATYRWS